jgi:hypothetical protein
VDLNARGRLRLARRINPTTKFRCKNLQRIRWVPPGPGAHVPRVARKVVHQLAGPLNQRGGDRKACLGDSVPQS